MPIYEYECQGCGHRFEEWQKMSDKPVEVCPKCNVSKVEKLISHTSFQLKGGGWYSDLYSSAKPAAGSSDATSSKGNSSGASSKTDSKTDSSSAASSSTASSSTSGGSKGKGASQAAA